MVEWVRTVGFVAFDASVPGVIECVGVGHIEIIDFGIDFAELHFGHYLMWAIIEKLHLQFFIARHQFVADVVQKP